MGKNLTHWAKSVKFFFTSKGKMEYLDGSKKGPDLADPGYDVNTEFSSIENNTSVQIRRNKLTSNYNRGFEVGDLSLASILSLPLHIDNDGMMSIIKNEFSIQLLTITNYMRNN